MISMYRELTLSQVPATLILPAAVTTQIQNEYDFNLPQSNLINAIVFLSTSVN